MVSSQFADDADTVVLTVLVILIELTAAWVVKLPSGGLGTESLQVGVRLLRISMPAVIFMTLSGMLTGLLFSLKRFTLPAFSAVAVNACVVVAALLFGQQWGVMSMAVGLLVGSVAQVLVLLPGLRDANLRPVFNLASSRTATDRETLYSVDIQPCHLGGGGNP